MAVQFLAVPVIPPQVTIAPVPGRVEATLTSVAPQHTTPPPRS